MPCANRPRAHKAEGEGVEPWAPRKRGQLIARPLSGRLPSPIGLTFRTKRLRQKGSNLHPLLNRRVDYRYLMPDQESGWPDLNRRSRAPDDHAAHGARRNSRLSYILPASPKQIVLPSNILRRSPTNRPAQDPEERPAGVEPALPPWQGDRPPRTNLRSVPACQLPTQTKKA